MRSFLVEQLHFTHFGSAKITLIEKKTISFTCCCSVEWCRVIDELRLAKTVCWHHSWCAVLLLLLLMMMTCVCVCVSALRIHISKPCYIGLLEIGGYEMTLRGEMSVKV